MEQVIKEFDITDVMSTGQVLVLADYEGQMIRIKDRERAIDCLYEVVQATMTCAACGYFVGNCMKLNCKPKVGEQRFFEGYQLKLIKDFTTSIDYTDNRLNRVNYRRFIGKKLQFTFPNETIVGIVKDQELDCKDCILERDDINSCLSVKCNITVVKDEEF